MANKIRLIDSGSGARGFFATINLTLMTLQHCAENDLDPVIDSSVLSLYGTDVKKIRPFSEFYGEIYPEDRHCLKTIEIDYIFNRGVTDFNDPDVMRKLAVINDILLGSMGKDLKCFIDNPPLGSYQNTTVSVHYRGCDYLRNVPQNHFRNYTQVKFLTKISEIVEDREMFIATDDYSMIGLMKSYGYEFSYFEDVYRGRPGVGSHFKSFFEKLGFGAPEKQKRKGFEVIRDVHWLSKNRTYIGSNSNLMYYSKLLNLDQDQINLSTLDV